MQGSKAAGGIMGLRLRAAYTLKKAHEFEMQLSGKLRSAFGAATRPSGQELFVQASYRYRFNLTPFEKTQDASAKVHEPKAPKQHGKREREE